MTRPAMKLMAMASMINDGQLKSLQLSQFLGVLKELLAVLFGLNLINAILF
jgi:hypothetical protein